MYKYNVRVCQCGRIHLIPQEKIEKAIHSNKELVFICSGCGAATVIGADKHLNFYEGKPEYVYDMYSFNWSFDKGTVVNADSFVSSNRKVIDEIIYTPGIRVPMMTGMYATDFSSGAGFSDRWYPDFYELDVPNLTVEKVRTFLEKYRKDRKTVNMNRLIYENDEESLKVISSRPIEGLDWTGTPYDNWWTKESNKTDIFSE